MFLQKSRESRKMNLSQTRFMNNIILALSDFMKFIFILFRTRNEMRFFVCVNNLKKYFARHKRLTLTCMGYQTKR